MKRKEDEILEAIKECDDDVVKQMLALVKLCFHIMSRMRKQIKGLIVARVILAVSFIGYAVYQSQYAWVETTTISTTMDASGENANINSVEGDQYNDSATHTE